MKKKRSIKLGGRMGDDNRRRAILRRCLRKAGYGVSPEAALGEGGVRNPDGNPDDKEEKWFDWVIVYLDEHDQLGWMPFNGSLTRFNNTFESIEKDKTLRLIVGAKPLRWKAKK